MIWFFLLALAPGGFTGPDACAECHRTQYQKQSRSHHALALRAIAEKRSILSDVADGAFRITYDEGGQVKVGDVTARLLWAFGAGAQGITPVGVYEGRYFENRFSYYAAAHGLAVTFGHPKRASSAEAELGILQDGKTISQCFVCHATGVRPSSSGPDLSAMIPGITCERCHGPGAAHVAAAKSGADAAAVRRTLVNPGRFPARAQIEMCGECHRLPGPDNLSPEPEVEDPVSVRMAPIGLLASRCFQESKRLSCLTCHDPHADARPRSDALYTDRCLGCHSEKAKGKCPRRADCVSCHLPAAALGPYLRFTDHRIR